MSDEQTPLLAADGYQDPHTQFCIMVGVPSSERSDKHQSISSRSLYGRAKHQFNQARALHAFMASMSTTSLLAQVVIGAAVTALGASRSSHILITLFGATNTVIAGVVAYLKSRGQPMRSRMFRDDLERVVDEIENSETMWLGITRNIHGYDEIDIEDKVTVRSEVARLMRLYERAMRNNMLNNPDNYLLSNSDTAGTALRARPAGVAPQAPISLPVISPIPPATVPAPDVATVAPAATAPADDPDQSPVTAPPKALSEEATPQNVSNQASKGTAKKTSTDAANGGTEDPPAQEETQTAAPGPAPDPDASPASLPSPPAPKSKREAPDDGRDTNVSEDE